MIAWATIDAAIKSAISTASGVTEIRWKWQPSAMRAAISIDLRRSPVEVIGQDERVHRYTAPSVDPVVAESFKAYQRGQRRFAVEVRCYSDRGAPSDTAPIDSADILSVLVTRMYRTSVLDALTSAGCALSAISSIVRSDYSVDKREISLAIVTLTFLTADVDLDTDEYWIETVLGNLVVTTPDGSTITTPFSAQVTE